MNNLHSISPKYSDELLSLLWAFTTNYNTKLFRNSAGMFYYKGFDNGLNNGKYFILNENDLFKKSWITNWIKANKPSPLWDRIIDE